MTFRAKFNAGEGVPDYESHSIAFATKGDAERYIKRMKSPAPGYPLIPGEWIIEEVEEIS